MFKTLFVWTSINRTVSTKTFLAPLLRPLVRPPLADITEKERVGIGEVVTASCDTVTLGDTLTEYIMDGLKEAVPFILGDPDADGVGINDVIERGDKLGGVRVVADSAGATDGVGEKAGLLEYNQYAYLGAGICPSANDAGTIKEIGYPRQGSLTHMPRLLTELRQLATPTPLAPRFFLPGMNTA